MNPSIQIRPAQASDGPQIGQLIYDTIHAVNSKDYDPHQIEAWAPDSFLFSTCEDPYVYVAELREQILGFGSFTADGYLHRFYIHRDFQRRGIGKLLLEALEERAKNLYLTTMTTEASITALPFFLSRGWVRKEKQTKVFRGVSFINFKMVKKLL